VVELGSMPYLQSLTTSNIPYSFDSAILPQLLYLDAFAPTPDYQINIDDIPRHIQVLRLERYILRQRRKTSASPRQFPDLCELALKDVGISGLVSGFIMAPKLENISFGSQIAEGHLDLAPTLQTFCLNGTPFGSTVLRQLTIEGMEFGAEIVSYMRRLHNLQTLELSSCRICKAFLTSLWTSSEHMTLLLLSAFLSLKTP
jgi:hypothetical protein